MIVSFTSGVVLRLILLFQVKKVIHSNNGKNKPLSALERFVAGSSAGIMSQTSIYPMEVSYV